MKAIHSFVVDSVQEILTFHDVDDAEEAQRAFIEALPSDDGQKAAKYVLSIEDSAKSSLSDQRLSDSIGTLWAVPAVKARFAETAKVRLNTACEHFFESLERISSAEYVPTDKDILLQRRPTTGLIEETIDHNDTTFTMVDVGGQRNERRKWIHQFENVAAVVYVVSLSAFDEPLYEMETVNSMHDALECFQKTVTTDSLWFKQSSLFLVFNKKDLFSDKISTQSMAKCFDPELYDERKMWTEIEDSAEREKVNREFIESQFLNEMKENGKQVQTFETCAYEEEVVKDVFEVILEHIVQKNMMAPP